MPNISQINLPGDNNTYDIADIIARGRIWQGTQAQYNALTTIDPDTVYFITDATGTVLATVATTGSYNDLTDKPQIDTSLDTTSSNAIANGPVASFAQSISQTVSNKMDKANPTGTGSLSLNRSGNTGTESVSIGHNCVASGTYSYAEGMGTTSSGNTSHAEGYLTTASGYYSHAEGWSTTASGTESHAEGDETQATGDFSHTEGMGTIAQRKSQHVFGEFNDPDTGGTGVGTKGNYIEIVGKGANKNSRSNARTLDWSGNEVLAGDLTINGSTSVGTALGMLSGLRSQVVQGNTRYKAQSTGSGYTNKPYGIFIIGYTCAYVASSVSPSSDLAVLNSLIAITGSAVLSLSNGVLQFGTDANRQFVCLMPESVRLVQQT